jgi:hypothetical protein
MSFVGTQTELHILEETIEMEPQTKTIVAEGVYIQNEEEIPFEAYEIEAQLEILGGDNSHSSGDHRCKNSNSNFLSN